MFTGHETIGGFTFQAMLSYYIVGSFLASLEMSSGVSGEVSSRIRGGTFSKFMVIPANPQLHFLSQDFGAVGYYGLFSVVVTALCVFLFQVQLIISPDPVLIIYGLLMTVAGLTFMVSYQFFIGIMTFALWFWKFGLKHYKSASSWTKTNSQNAVGIMARKRFLGQNAHYYI